MACTDGVRGFLVIFNFIFWLSGAALLGIGVWLSLDDDVSTFFEVIHVDTADPYFKYSAYILVGFGSFIFIVGFVGCCGALRRNQPLMAMYIFFLVVVMAGELTAGILTALYKNDIEAQLQDHLTEEVTMKYSDPRYGYLTRALDTIQSQVKCCGVNGPRDYEISFWKNNTAGLADNVPEVCCHFDSAKSNGPFPEEINTASCQASAYLPGGGDSVYSQGCYKAILEWFREHSVIVIGVGCGIAGLQLFGLLFAICMCCDSRKEEKYEE